MSIQHRLLIIYTLIFSVAYILFAVLVYWLPRNQVLAEIDEDLQALASEVSTASTVLGPGRTLRVPLPDDLATLQTASTFLIILDREQEVVVQSNNMSGYNKVLDPDGLGWQETSHLVQHEGAQLRVFTKPIFSADGRLIGHIQVARLLDNFEIFNEVLARVLLFGLTAALFSWLAAVLLTPSLFRPLDDIATVARQITRADDLSRRVPHANRADEIGELARSFNQTLERLERLFRSQQRFLADVSHELRTPLTSVRGNLDLMRRMGEYDPDSMDVIQEEMERMTRLVGDLLLLARADSGGLPLQRERVELDNVLFEVHRQVDRLVKSVELELTDVDQVSVLGDADRLKQLTLNLVDNAIKYTPAGGTVKLSLSKQNGWAHLSISDTGIGIPPEDLPHVFDRFYRVDKARTRSLGGSGLGLAIAKWIVQAHGGGIQVNSRVGEGTTFTVTLPVYRSPGEVAAGAEQEEKTRPGFRVLTPTLRRQG
jgi:heavy metal sensor kinase